MEGDFTIIIGASKVTDFVVYTRKDTPQLCDSLCILYKFPFPRPCASHNHAPSSYPRTHGRRRLARYSHTRPKGKGLANVLGP